MIAAEEKSRLQTLVDETREERSRVKRLVASGNWQAAERDTERSKAYATQLQLKRAVAPSSRAEAIVGDTVDYQPVSFLVEGARTRRAVGFVEVNTPTTSELGSGFLVSPRLFITNQHVIRDVMAAHSAAVTFDREMDENGRPRATTAFQLDPETCAVFSAENELDYALIAVGARISGDATLADLGYCMLSDTPDRHVIGMNVNIVQHPNGWPKTVALRNNTLTFRTERTLLYETDTQPGSSGSPVFNDGWDLVALHHYGAPFLERTDAAGNPLPQSVNEGVRISAIVRDLRARLGTLPLSMRALVEEALALSTANANNAIGGRTLGPPRPRPNLNGSGETMQPLTNAATLSNSATAQSLTQSISTHTSANQGAIMNTTSTIQTTGTLGNDGTVKITIPLEISLRLGGATAAADSMMLGTGPVSTPPKLLTRASEALKIDENYANRSGYNEKFINGATLPLPKLSAALKRAVAPLRGNDATAADGLLNYEHFSLVMHKSRRVAIFTATNIDGATYLNVDRKTGQAGDAEAEQWFKDPRVSDAFTLNQDFYSAWSSYFDRGHLTRRTDPTWGTAEEAERANADTFHFSNCSPQHFRFNQTAKFWQGAERYVLENGVLAAGNGKRITVIQGPIFDDNIDLWADDVQIPSSFFKIIVWKGATGLKAVGLIVDQLALLSESRVALKPPAQLASVNVSHWRVGIKTIEEKTGLDFGKTIRDADTISAGGQPAVGAEKAVLMRDSKDLLA
jgi:endonuclease G, mitochondrial